MTNRPGSEPPPTCVPPDAPVSLPAPLPGGPFALAYLAMALGGLVVPLGTVDRPREQRRDTATAPAADQGDEEQEAERQVAEQVGDEVEGGPVARPAEEQEIERADAGNAPADEGIQAGVDDERPVQPRQRYRGAAVTRHPRRAAGRASGQPMPGGAPSGEQRRREAPDVIRTA